MANPSTQMEGMSLEDGWVVGALLPKKPQTTGGNFCQCYKVRSTSGAEAFLKALDYYEAFGADTEVIQRITTLFNFERDLLGICKQRNMDRVVRVIGSGIATVGNDSDHFNRVPYLIFESADADIRFHLDDATSFSTTAWKLRAIHHMATGLKQLHSADIVHQDLGAC